MNSTGQVHLMRETSTGLTTVFGQVLPARPTPGKLSAKHMYLFTSCAEKSNAEVSSKRKKAGSVNRQLALSVQLQARAHLTAAAPCLQKGTICQTGNMAIELQQTSQARRDRIHLAGTRFPKCSQDETRGCKM